MATLQGSEAEVVYGSGKQGFALTCMDGDVEERQRDAFLRFAKGWGTVSGGKAFETDVAIALVPSGTRLWVCRIRQGPEDGFGRRTSQVEGHLFRRESAEWRQLVRPEAWPDRLGADSQGHAVVREPPAVLGDEPFVVYAPKSAQIAQLGVAAPVRASGEEPGTDEESRSAEGLHRKKGVTRVLRTTVKAALFLAIGSASTWWWLGLEHTARLEEMREAEEERKADWSKEIDQANSRSDRLQAKLDEVQDSKEELERRVERLFDELKSAGKDVAIDRHQIERSVDEMKDHIAKLEDLAEKIERILDSNSTDKPFGIPR